MSLSRLLSAALVVSLVFVGALAAVGCNPPPSSFGLGYRYLRDDGTKGTSCSLAGNAQGGSATLVAKARDEKGKDTFPHLWVESHQDGGDTPYTLDVYTTRGYQGDTLLPADKEIVKSVAYAEAFGAGQQKDSFTVVFEGKSVAFDVQGIPAAATSCPFGVGNEPSRTDAKLASDVP